MDASEARIIVDRARDPDALSEEDFFLYVEAVELLIQETKDPNWMLELGAAYYGRKNYDLALKYYEESAALGNKRAMVNLGYIWYYGRTGVVDYKKAFDCFSAVPSDVNAQYKLADMYRNGRYVEKDPDKYREIIEKLYVRIGEDEDDYHLPEICSRLASIRAEQGKKEEAVELLLKGKEALALRIEYDAFFGNLRVMKRLIQDLYKLVPFDRDNFDLFDLFELLRTPAKARFKRDGKEHTAESVEEDGAIAICFDGKWFRTIDDFFDKATIDGDRLASHGWELYDFEALSWT